MVWTCLDHEEKKRYGRDGRAVDQIRVYPSWVPWDNMRPSPSANSDAVGAQKRK